MAVRAQDADVERVREARIVLERGARDLDRALEGQARHRERGGRVKGEDRPDLRVLGRREAGWLVHVVPVLREYARSEAEAAKDTLARAERVLEAHGDGRSVCVPILGRTPDACFKELHRHLGELVAATLTDRPLVRHRREPNVLVLSFRAGEEPVAVPVETRHGRLFFYLGQRLEALKERRGYRLRTLDYWYRLQEGPSLKPPALIRWEYARTDPAARGPCRHHVQIQPSRERPGATAPPRRPRAVQRVRRGRGPPTGRTGTPRATPPRVRPPVIARDDTDPVARSGAIG